MRDSRGDIRVSVPVGGRLTDPRFDFRETIRSAIRTVAINTITLPVSWIGRLQASPDSRIERVEVDPIRFQPASAVLTADGRTQATRVAAFLGQVGEVRMALAPVVSRARPRGAAPAGGRGRRRTPGGGGTALAGGRGGPAVPRATAGSAGAGRAGRRRWPRSRTPRHHRPTRPPSPRAGSRRCSPRSRRRASPARGSSRRRSSSARTRRRAPSS